MVLPVVSVRTEGGAESLLEGPAVATVLVHWLPPRHHSAPTVGNVCLLVVSSVSMVMLTGHKIFDRHCVVLHRVNLIWVGIVPQDVCFSGSFVFFPTQGSGSKLQ